jgi:hypothetical protein
MRISETVKDDGNTRILIAVDPDPINPRGRFDNLGVYALTIDTFRGRYVEVDPTGGPLEDGWDRISWRRDAVDVFERWARTFHGAVTLFSHSMEGAAVIWYALPKEWTYGEFEPEFVLKYLREVDAEYRAWASGEVYGVIKARRHTWTNQETGEEREQWTPVQSVWNLYGYDEARAVAERADMWQ